MFEYRELRKLRGENQAHFVNPQSLGAIIERKTLNVKAGYFD